MKNLLIDGLALGGFTKITGVQRASRELILKMDDLADEYPFKIYYLYSPDLPNALINPNGFKNIVPQKAERKSSLPGFALRTFFRYTRKLNGIIFNMVTTGRFPLQKNQMSFIYDLRPVIFNYDAPFFKGFYARSLKFIKNHSKVIFTDSNFQKSDIEKYYRLKDKNKVKTIYMGYEHMIGIEPDASIFEQYPVLKEKGYYYALGSLAPHKNFEWIVQQAKRFPSIIFAICGEKDSQLWNANYDCADVKNLLFLGRLSDEQNKALMINCRGFLMPSKYEGFGIPPLEALYCGAPVFCSNASCLPEIYEDSVHYFDPDDYDYDLEAHLNEPLAGGRSKILEKCNWRKSAKCILDIFAEAYKK